MWYEVLGNIRFWLAYRPRNRTLYLLVRQTRDRHKHGCHCSFLGRKAVKKKRSGGPPPRLVASGVELSVLALLVAREGKKGLLFFCSFWGFWERITHSRKNIFAQKRKTRSCAMRTLRLWTRDGNLKTKSYAPLAHNYAPDLKGNLWHYAGGSVRTVSPD